MERIEKSPAKPEPDVSAENSFTLTRAKARALNQCLSQIPPLILASSDVTSLIDEELASDEDDDEYQPGDEEPPVNILNVCVVICIQYLFLYLQF